MTRYRVASPIILRGYATRAEAEAESARWDPADWQARVEPYLGLGRAVRLGAVQGGGNAPILGSARLWRVVLELRP